NGVALRVNNGLCVPDGIPRKILAASDVAVESVHLDATRADSELEGAPAVIERIDQEPDGVISGRRVAVGEVRANLGRVRIERAKRHQQPAPIERQQARRLDRRWYVVSRKPLEPEGNLNRVLPGRLVELAVDGDGRCCGTDLELLRLTR